MAYYHRALSERALGKHADAVRTLDQVITLDPEFALAYYQKGASLQKLGRNGMQSRHSTG
jgi:tetratricopeptide (TPR) repeat protein